MKGNVCTFASPGDSYTLIRNNIFREGKNITPAAGWIYCQMLSLPKDWEMTVAGLVALNSCGKSVVSRALLELEEKGYLIRAQARDSHGRMDGRLYILLENPADWETALNHFGIDPSDVLTERPTKDQFGTKVQFSGSGKSAGGKSTTINYFPNKEGEVEGNAQSAPESAETEDFHPEPSPAEIQIPAQGDLTPSPAEPQASGVSSEPTLAGRLSHPGPMDGRGAMPLPSLAPEGFRRVWDAYPKKPAVPATPVDFEQSELGLAIKAYSGLIEAGWTDERVYQAMELYKEAILRRNGAASWAEIGVTYLKTLKNALTDANLSPFAPAGTWEADAALRDKQASDARFADLKALRHAVDAHLDSLPAQEGAAIVCQFWTERAASDADGIVRAASGLLDTYQAGYAITALPMWERISHVTKYDKKVNAEFCMWYSPRYLQTEEKAA